jgi:ABC-type Na+ efflux pump permease subunit
VEKPMKLNKEELRGTKSVLGFTLKQYAKSKANRIMLAILIVLALISVPVMSFILGDDGNKEVNSSISKVYIDNATDYGIDIQALSSDALWRETEFVNSPSAGSDLSDRLSEKEAAVSIAFDQEKSSFIINTYTSEDGEVSKYELNNLGNLMFNKLNESRYKAVGATDEQLSTVMSSYNVDSMSMEKYTAQDKGPGMGTLFTVQYAYAIAVFMLCLFSTIYIIRAIIEEKDSKLVELLMVSVKPLALILGKILAVMVYIFTTTLMILAAFGLSYLAGGMITGTEKVGKLIKGMGLTSSVMNLSPMTIVIVLVSLALGYLTISIVGGISGTSCSSMEDVESANMAVLLIVMFGYLVSCIAVPFSTETGNSAVAIIVSLFPIVSIFCAPVQYICGNVSIYILLLSWLIQIGLITLLAVFCSRVYEGLVIHKGSRVKLKELLSMAGLRKAKEVHE